MFTKIRLLAATMTLAALMPLAATHAATPDSGLLITQVTGSKWQVRLIAGATTPQRFAGSFTASSGVNSMSTIKLETGDVVRINAERNLEVSFDASVNSFDGAYFWTPQTSQICVRNTGGTDTKVYLGASLADATEVSLPLNLQGEDPCGILPPKGPYVTDRKFNPGHYTVLLRGQNGLKFMNDALRPGNVGLVKRYTWRKLEPTQGGYDFSAIVADLNWARSYGQQIIVMIEDKTFSAEDPAPAYLAGISKPNRIGGYTMLRWHPTYTDRWKALVAALGARFDSHPNFEGIATQETSLGLEGAELSAYAYTPEKYRDAYIEQFESGLASMPKSRIFWYQNFLLGNQSYIGQVAKAVGPKGLVMAGPDVLPDKQDLVKQSYPFYATYKGWMHMGIQIEGICYKHPHATAGYSTKYWTPDELFAYARDKLYANYVFWVRIPTASPTDSYDWYDALPVIEANPVFTPQW
ncbi:MAG TPA: hypothetical protein VNS57_10740 [Steroidobacteraceae bacterium]|nr:hypothetical protein [Steroidobacteraceae bacterium]